MSATIGNNVQIKEILKATGFDCPVDLEGKTFSEATSGGGSGGGDFLGAYSKYIGRGYCFWVCSSKDISAASYTDNGQDYNITVVDSHSFAVSGSINVEKFNITFTDGQTVELDTITDVSY